MNKNEQKIIATNIYNLSKRIKTLQKQQEELKSEESQLKEEVRGLMEELRVKKIRFKDLNVSISHPIAEVDPGILRMEYPELAKKFVEEKTQVFISALNRKILKREYPEVFEICKADDPTPRLTISELKSE